MKKFDFKILTYLYVLRAREFIYAIFIAIYVCMYVRVWEWIRGLHRPNFSDQERNWNLGPSPARSEREIEILAQARPGLKRSTKFWPGPGPANFFTDFGPDSLV